LFHELVAGTRDHYQMEKRYIRKDGSVAWGHLTVSLVRRADTDPQFVIRMVEDITARKQAEAALRESEARYRLIAENANDVICVFDQAGRYIYASPSFQRLLGEDSHDVIGTTPFDRIHPDDRVLALERWKQLPTRESMEVTFRYRRADGAWRWLETSATLTIRGDETVVVAVGRDITERRDLEAHLGMVQKLESVGRLASGAAHEFNNQLTGICAYADLAMTSLPADHEVRHDLEEIQQITERAAHFARQLLTFARKEPAAPRAIDLNDHICEMVRFLRRLIGEDIELVTILTSEPALVNVDPGQFEQLIVNVALNARDAMPEGGRLFIETSHVIVDAEYAHRHTDMHAGSYVLLTISDTGIGMAPEVQAHIFEPFFTTKDPDEGTGLGLPISYGIVKQHDGSIWVYSEPQRGTTFKIYLPRSTHGAGEVLSPPDLTDELPDGTETVLLVEDEPTVLGLTARMLRSLGYTVLEASNGDEALRVAQTYSETPIHILLTDVVLPKLSGQGVAEQLLRLQPGIKVLFTSGYTEHVVVHHGRLTYDVAFLQKPFRYATLASKVREVLDS
jgi:PAS domain S-box-containing protein